MLQAPGRPLLPKGVVVAGLAAVVLHVFGALALSGAGWAGHGKPSRLASGHGGMGEPGSRGAATGLQVRLAGAPHPMPELSVPLEEEASSVSLEPSAIDDAPRLLSESAPAAGGQAAFASTYLSADEVDQGPVPELGWILDESALEQVGRARMRLRLWVSENGRIDRISVIHAEPAGDWVERAIRPLPDTRMRPAERDARPVASTIVVELSSDLETMR